MAPFPLASPPSSLLLGWGQKRVGKHTKGPTLPALCIALAHLVLSPLPGPLPGEFWAVVVSALIPESHSWEVRPGGAHKSTVGTQERSPSGTLTGSCFSIALSNLAKEYASSFVS